MSRAEENRQIIEGLGEEAVARGEEVRGVKDFHNDPTAPLRKPEYFGRGVVNGHRSGAEDPYREGTVELINQGPLPIEYGGETHMVQAASLVVVGLNSHEQALAVFNGLDHENPEQTLYVAVEDHVNLVVQAEGGASFWNVFDGALGNFSTLGGGVVLLPESAQSWTQEYLQKVGQDVALLVGLQKVKLLRPDKDHVWNHEPRVPVDFARPDAGQLCYLKERLPWLKQDFEVQRMEWVQLPWGDRPFLHLELKERKGHGTYHTWVYGEVEVGEDVPVRPHSACSSSEILGANNCDCPEQLDGAFRQVVEDGWGVVMHIPQEARGHGIFAKVGTWDFNIGHRIDLISSFNAAGLKEDVRQFDGVARILEFLGIRSINLLSNNGWVKGRGLADAGVDIASTTSVKMSPRSEYAAIDLKAKRDIRGDNFSNGHTVVDGEPVIKRH